jgi:hypothetical protein
LNYAYEQNIVGDDFDWLTIFLIYFLFSNLRASLDNLCALNLILEAKAEFIDD